MTDKTQPIMRFNLIGGLVNPEARGLYVRYEDYVAALQAAPPAPAAVAVAAPEDSVKKLMRLVDYFRGAAQFGCPEDMQVAREDIESAIRAALAAAPAQEHATQLAPPAVRPYIGHVKCVADLVNNLLLLDQTLPIYGAQYIEHPPGKRRAIAVPPTVSREQVKDSRWIGEGHTLNAAVIWTRAEKPAAPAQAQEDARDAESDYQRGYRHGYNRRDAEVQGALL